MTLFPLYNISPHFPPLEGDGEVLRTSNGADVQPAKEAANPGEGSPGTHREICNSNVVSLIKVDHIQAVNVNIQEKKTS